MSGSLSLSNGVSIPAVSQGCAFGNWTGTAGQFQGFLPEQAWRATTLALKVGLRSFDGAHAYGTERHVGDVLGRAFAEGTLTRDDVFLTTKVAHPRPALPMSHKRTWNPRDVPSIRQQILDTYDTSLNEMGVGRFDLVLLHWPGHWEEKDPEFAKKARQEMWATMEEILQRGTARAIGVCNFSKRHLEELSQSWVVKPMLNQFELHPYCQAHELVEYCDANGILVQAYAPFASGEFGLLSDEVLKGIADRVGKSLGQVILRWQVQQGHAVIPKSSSEVRMAQNMQVFDFELSADDMKAIAGLHPAGSEAKRTCPDPSTIL